MVIGGDQAADYFPEEVQAMASLISIGDKKIIPNLGTGTLEMKVWRSKC